jgi:hypothetical protein
VIPRNRASAGVAAAPPAGAEVEGAERQRRAADDDPGLRGAGPLERHLAQCGDRCHAGGPDGRHQRRDERDADADEEGDHHRGEPQREPAGGQLGPGALERRRDPRREEDAEPEAQERADEADHHGLDEDGPQDLPASGADGPEEGQLAGALRDQDRERVGDHEDADQEGDAAEDRQEGLEEGEAGLDVARQLGGGLLAGDDLGAVREDRADPVDELLLGDAVVGPDQDLLDLPVGAGEALGLGEREVGADGAARALGRAEEELADERVVLAPELRQDADLVADVEPAVLHRLDVERDLVVAPRPPPLVEVVGAHRRVAGPVLDQRRRALGGPEGLALAVEDPVGGAEPDGDHEGHGLGHAVDPLDLVHEAGVEQAALVAHPAEAVGEQDGALDLGVDVLVGGGEQVVEALVHRVGQHEGAGHEADAEHDRHDRGDESSLVLPEGPAGESEHQEPRSFMRSMTLAALGSPISPTILPSARNSTRSE